LKVLFIFKNIFCRMTEV